MASGCTVSNNTINLFQKLTPDTTIKYTGAAFSTLGVCPNDTLDEVEYAILTTLINYSTGIGISIPGINLSTGTCAPLFSSCISCCGACTDLPCLLECYYTAFCTLYSEITALQTKTNALLNGPYNIGCLQNVTVASPVNQIIQEMILELCTAEANIASLQTTVGGLSTSAINSTIGTFIASAINSCQGSSCVNISGTGASTTISFKGFTPVGGVIMYTGALSNFDHTGLGFSNTPMCGWALCNGNNGTVNMQGQVGVGMTTMGGSTPSNASGLTLTTLSATLGEVNHTLTSNEVPATPLNVTDSGHTHAVVLTGRPTGGSTVIQPSNPLDNAIPADAMTYNTSTSHANVTGSVNGGGNSHNNMQPSTAIFYIQRIA